MPHMDEVLAVDDAAQLPPGVGRRREAPTGELLLEPREDRLVRQTLALELQMASSNEGLRLLAQERQHLVDHPFGLAALQAAGSRQIVHEVFQIVRLGVAHATLLEKTSVGNNFCPKSGRITTIEQSTPERLYVPAMTVTQA